ncbi:MAG: F0F1 ATP synthase subunit beta, partial [Candidatus Omnitrophica bacterium]|nr:F0F1 ATP synthase subunit beta [Candidatus Omnitrophota bacterium]
EVVKYFQKYEELQHIVAIIGKEELYKHERVIFERAIKLQNFLTQPFFAAELYTGRPGVYVTLEETIKGCEMILSGRMDSVPDDKFYMIGALEKERG